MLQEPYASLNCPRLIAGTNTHTLCETCHDTDDSKTLQRIFYSHPSFLTFGRFLRHHATIMMSIPVASLVDFLRVVGSKVGLHAQTLQRAHADCFLSLLCVAGYVLGEFGVCPFPWALGFFKIFEFWVLPFLIWIYTLVLTHTYVLWVCSRRLEH